MDDLILTTPWTLPQLMGAKLWLVASRARIGAAQFVAARSESLSNANAIVTSGNFSVDAYIYLDTITADMVIFDQGPAAASKQLLRVESGDSKVYFSMDGGTTNSLSAALSTGTWYHVVGTYDGTNQKLYINGALVDTDAVSVDYADVDRFAIGSATAGGSYMNGRVCLVRIWSKELLQAEVTSLYNGGRGLSHAQLSGSLLTGLVDSYNLSEASGTRADSAGAKTLTDNNTVMCALGIIPVIPADGVVLGIADDLSGNGNHASESIEDSMPTYQTADLAGKPVVRFDGTNDAMLIPDFADVSADGKEITAIVVAKAAAGALQTIFSHWDGAAGQRSWAIMQSATNKMRVLVSTDGTTAAGKYKDYSGATDISGAFHILTMTWNNGTLALYVNGVAEALTKTADGAITTLKNSTAALAIGASLDNGVIAGFSLNGDIAELCTINRALTAGELNRLHLHLGRKYGIGVT